MRRFILVVVLIALGVPAVASALAFSPTDRSSVRTSHSADSDYDVAYGIVEGTKQLSPSGLS